MSEDPPHSISMLLCVSLASLVFGISALAFANEPDDAPVAALSDLLPEPALEVVPDLSAIEEFEHQMNRELTADVGQMLDAIVEDRLAQQMRWLAQHYFDAATARGRVSPGASPVAQVSPANQR